MLRRLHAHATAAGASMGESARGSAKPEQEGEKMSKKHTSVCIECAVAANAEEAI